MRFTTRVELFSSHERWLGVLSSDRAKRYLETRGTDKRPAAIVFARRRGLVSAIQLTREIGKPERPPTPPSLTQYMGQRYHRVEPVGIEGQEARCFAFKRIDPEDREIFCLSVMDNLSNRRS